MVQLSAQALISGEEKKSGEKLVSRGVIDFLSNFKCFEVGTEGEDRAVGEQSLICRP